MVASLVKGKSVSEALGQLDFLAKRASTPIKKLILSAASNAKQAGMEMENLFIKKLTVDKGIVMKRMRPAAMGMGHRINKRTSNVSIVLGEKVAKIKKTKTNKKVKAEEKK